MNREKTSGIGDILNLTYNFLRAECADADEDAIKQALTALLGVAEFDFSADTARCSYGDLQNRLATLNEKSSGRKSNGVYYTPGDVVRFITYNCIKSAYGLLRPNDLGSDDLGAVPCRQFCLKKTVLDPTCGAGEFLLAALETKFDLWDGKMTAETLKKIIATLHGNDIDPESTAIAKIRLFLSAVHRYGMKICAGAEIILNKNFTNTDFVSAVPDFGRKFDLIIGNPPYVEDRKSGAEPLKNYGNIYANVLKNSADILSGGGSLGFVIPLSYISTPRMKTIREELFEIIPEQYILSYADRPDCLFKSVHQKLCILIGKKRGGKKSVYTGSYQYWYREEREGLFSRAGAVENNFMTEAGIPKLGYETDVNIYKKICDLNAAGNKGLNDLQNNGSESVYLNMRAAFWIKAFRKPHRGAEYKRFTFKNAADADIFSCIVNSSLFWWYWICTSDCWHITGKELKNFPAPTCYDPKIASELAAELEDKLEKTKRYVGTKQTEFEYKHRCCADEIHAIDDYVNALFGLSEAEGRYIKEFSYRYRVSGGPNESN